jgi:hypothetical protein
VAGGWGVDALLGRETRPHHDLDLLVSVDDLGELQDLLADQGFSRKLVWEENRWVDVRGAQSPTAFVEVDSLGRELDIHVIQLVQGRPPIALYDLAWEFSDDSLEGVGYGLPPLHQSDVDQLRLLADE